MTPAMMSGVQSDFLFLGLLVYANASLNELSMA